MFSNNNNNNNNNNNINNINNTNNNLYNLIRNSQNNFRDLIDIYCYQLDTINRYATLNENNRPFSYYSRNNRRYTRFNNNDNAFLYRYFVNTTPFNSNINGTTNNGLTNEQIEQNTTSNTYNNIDNPLSITQCPISHQEFDNNTNVIRINNCNHIFVRNSLLTWLTTHRTCPVCRCNIITNNNEESNQNNNDNNNQNNNENNETTNETNTQQNNRRINNIFAYYNTPLNNTTNLNSNNIDNELNNIALDFLRDLTDNNSNIWNY